MSISFTRRLNRWVYFGYNFEKISLKILGSSVKMNYIFFKEIINSNFKKIGIGNEENEFRLANLFRKIKEENTNTRLNKDVLSHF